MTSVELRMETADYSRYIFSCAKNREEIIQMRLVCIFLYKVTHSGWKREQQIYKDLQGCAKMYNLVRCSSECKRLGFPTWETPILGLEIICLVIFFFFTQQILSTTREQILLILHFAYHFSRALI